MYQILHQLYYKLYCMSLDTLLHINRKFKLYFGGKNLVHHNKSILEIKLYYYSHYITST